MTIGRRGDQIGGVEQIEAEALQWHGRARSGEMSVDEQRRFAQWCADPAHEAAYAELIHVWRLMEPSPGVYSSRVMERRGRLEARRRRGRHIAIAASLLMAISLGWQYINVWRHDAVANGSRTIARRLDDGTRLLLAPGAAVDIDYSDGERRVGLARGEVFFDVTHDAMRPFVIDAGGAQVRVLGTAFSVRRDGSRGRVTVVRGRVQVVAGASRAELDPGETIGFDTGGETSVGLADPEKALAWTKGRLIFEHKPLGEVLASVDRWYPGLIWLKDSKAAAKPINAAIDLNRIDDWLATLERSQRLSVRHYPGLTLIE